MATFGGAGYNAAKYASFRPTYPQSLFKFIFEYHRNSSVNSHWGTVVDLGCGTGEHREPRIAALTDVAQRVLISILFRFRASYQGVLAVYAHHWSGTQREDVGGSSQGSEAARAQGRTRICTVCCGEAAIPRRQQRGSHHLRLVLVIYYVAVSCELTCTFAHQPRQPTGLTGLCFGKKPPVCYVPEEPWRHGYVALRESSFLSFNSNNLVCLRVTPNSG